MASLTEDPRVAAASDARPSNARSAIPTPANIQDITYEWLESMAHEEWGYTQSRDFQIRYSLALILGTDIMLTVATGMGKSALGYIPILAAKALGLQHLAINIVPTISLANDQVLHPHL